MEGWLIVGGFWASIILLGWIFGKIKEYNERVRSKQRDEVAVNVVAEYGLNNIDKSELTSKFEYVNNNLQRRVIESEPYEINIPNKVQRHQGELCPKCHEGFLVRRQGKYGYFLGCTMYPHCTNTKPDTRSDKWAKTARKNSIAKEFQKDLEKAYS